MMGWTPAACLLVLLLLSWVSRRSRQANSVENITCRHHTDAITATHFCVNNQPTFLLLLEGTLIQVSPVTTVFDIQCSHVSKQTAGFLFRRLENHSAACRFSPVA